MRWYLQLSFSGLTRTRKRIDLGPVYGEWIIYSGEVPKYHVNCFDGSESGNLIDTLLKKRVGTIDYIIGKVNAYHKLDLVVQKRFPLFYISMKEERVYLDLPQIPIELLRSSL